MAILTHTQSQATLRTKRHRRATTLTFALNHHKYPTLVLCLLVYKRKKKVNLIVPSITRDLHVKLEF